MTVKQKRKAYNNKYYLDNKYKWKGYYSANPQRFRQQAIKYKLAHPKKFKSINRAYELKSSYGISLDDYTLLYNKQNGRCAVCNKKQRKYKLCVDHCHTTFKIRGLLCRSCNLALGSVKDNPKLLIKLARYLNAS